jgi:hypothetical protein
MQAIPISLHPSSHHDPVTDTSSPTGTFNIIQAAKLSAINSMSDIFPSKVFPFSVLWLRGLQLLNLFVPFVNRPCSMLL